MDSKTEERLLNLFREASDGLPPDAHAIDAEESAQAASRSHADSANEYPSGPAETSSFDPSLDSGAGQSYHGTSGSASANSGSSSGGIGSTLESVAGSFGGALGLVPLLGSLFGLFDSKSTEQPLFPKYQMPPSISFEAADTANGVVNADYGQMGLPRLYESGESGAVSGGNGMNAGVAAPVPSGSSPNATVTGGAPGMPQISVNVQAMDAQSFMSYSGEIAKAVRDAMLNLSSLNDVVSEL